MRKIETILKILFLLDAIILIVTSAVLSPLFLTFLVICLLLGITLIFNKDASYNFKQTKRDLAIRKFEGWVLILFAALIPWMISNPGMWTAILKPLM